jgi:hypothetical protein
MPIDLPVSHMRWAVNDEHHFTLTEDLISWLREHKSEVLCLELEAVHEVSDVVSFFGTPP